MAVEPPPLKTHVPRPVGTPDLDHETAPPSKSYWWVWLIIFSLIGYGCYALYKFETAKKAAMSSMRGMSKPRSIPVVAATAHRGDMPVYLEGLGTVTAFNTVMVRPRVDGQLIHVNFTEGQFVRQGEVLAEIDPRPFQVALGQAQGNLAQAKGTLAKDEAALKDAQAIYERDKALYEEKIIAKQQLDTQFATVGQAQGVIEADKAAVAGALAAIESAKLNLTYTKVTAPISGRIGLRQVDAGNMVHSSDVNGIAVITQLQPISVLFSIPEDQLPPVLEKLRHGAKMPVTAFDRAGRTKLADGTLLTVDNQIDVTTGTSKLKATFPNNDSTLFPNQFVNARLALDTKRNALIIPAAAIQRGPTGTFVYVVRDDDTVAVRAVKTGLTQGTDVSIEEGLQAGEKIVTDGAEKLAEGMKVTLRSGNPGGSRRNSAAGSGQGQ